MRVSQSEDSRSDDNDADIVLYDSDDQACERPHILRRPFERWSRDEHDANAFLTYHYPGNHDTPRNKNELLHKDKRAKNAKNALINNDYNFRIVATPTRKYIFTPNEHDAAMSALWNYHDDIVIILDNGDAVEVERDTRSPYYLIRPAIRLKSFRNVSHGRLADERFWPGFLESSPLNNGAHLTWLRDAYFDGVLNKALDDPVVIVKLSQMLCGKNVEIAILRSAPLFSEF